MSILSKHLPSQILQKECSTWPLIWQHSFTASTRELESHSILSWARHTSWWRQTSDTSQKWFLTIHQSARSAARAKIMNWEELQKLFRNLMASKFCAKITTKLKSMYLWVKTGSKKHIWQSRRQLLRVICSWVKDMLSHRAMLSLRVMKRVIGRMLFLRKGVSSLQRRMKITFKSSSKTNRDKNVTWLRANTPNSSLRRISELASSGSFLMLPKSLWITKSCTKWTSILSSLWFSPTS